MTGFFLHAWHLFSQVGVTVVVVVRVSVAVKVSVTVKVSVAMKVSGAVKISVDVVVGAATSMVGRVMVLARVLIEVAVVVIVRVLDAGVGTSDWRETVLMIVSEKTVEVSISPGGDTTQRLNRGSKMTGIKSEHIGRPVPTAAWGLVKAWTCQ